MSDNNVLYRQNRADWASGGTRDKKKDNVIVVSEYDPVIFFTVLVLVGFGVVMIFSASYYKAMNTDGGMFSFFIKQGIAAVLGLCGMLTMAIVNYRKFLPKLAFPLYAAANLLLVYVRLFGEKRNGAWRWIDIPVFGTFQPSEVAKIAIIILLSAYISADRERASKLGGLIKCGLIMLVPIALVFWGKNMSTALIIAAVGFGMIFIVSPYTIPFVAAGAGGVGALVFYLINTDSFRGDRYNVWMDPFSDPTGLGFQTVQSLYAVASGGLFGLGLGQSNQKLLYMPEPHNDFIFAIICEELGFFGAAIVLILFGILIWRGMRVALTATDTFGMLLATGITIMLGVQVIINVAVVTNTIPNTGIPMPFISYGGTSVALTMSLMGILLNVSRYTKKT